jgi:predicted Rossmann-fold nucleotide-binding protein
MNLKEILVAAAESQADKVKDDMMSVLNSKEMEKKIASAINEKINLPFIPEDKEQELFEKVVDVVTDLLAGLFEGK